MRSALGEAQTTDPLIPDLPGVPSEHARSGLFEGASGSEPAGKGIGEPGGCACAGGARAPQRGGSRGQP